MALHPQEMGKVEVEVFLMHLAVDGQVIGFYSKSALLLGGFATVNRQLTHKIETIENKNPQFEKSE